MAATAAASDPASSRSRSAGDPPAGRASAARVAVGRGLAALLSALALLLAAAVGPAAADPANALPAETAPSDPALPAVIPSIDGWESADGTFSAAPDLRIVASDSALDRTAEITAEELATAIPEASVGEEARSGDLELVLDGSREELGDEGYVLHVGERITVTAATATGAFYGTRTVLQMLTQQLELPRGELVDVPDYAERGVTVCACVINISPEWIDRLLEEMSYLKLNSIVMEMKLKVDGYPQTNTWSYYTKEDVAEFVAKAEERGIEVIPEINSPGHMEIWLENLPELQLTNPATGEKDEVRMDITKEESFEFYTALMDEYDEVFTSDQWHMGVDEYMLGSGYSNFPQMLEFAHEKFGEEATENDVVAWYVNRVNAHVKERGKTLRIWNDGVITDNAVIDFDTDIVVEHWNNAASEVSPQTFVDWGHEVVNVSNSLYMVRGGYGVDSRGLYERGWTPTTFYNGEVTRGTEQILGARMSIWPDGGTPAEAENTTEERMFEPLRLVAQATWAGTTPWEGYDAFRSAMDATGRSPLVENAERHPLEDGTYLLADSADGAALTAGTDGDLGLSVAGDPFTFSATDDGYYTIRAADGRCLDLSREGTLRLNVPVQIGADAVLAACEDTTVQKWQLREVAGGVSVSNAASQQHLVVSAGLTDVPVAGEGFDSVPDGRIVQAPHDLGDTVWTVEGTVGLTVSLSAASAQPGDQVEVDARVSNDSPDPATGLRLRVASLPEGWTALPQETELGDLPAGEGAEAALTLFDVAGSGAGTVAFEVVDAAGTVIASATQTLRGVCATGTVQPSAIADVSSEQATGEPAPNGPAAAAIDGDPGTYWHSQWSPSEEQHPHSIVVDLGETQEVCGLVYTPRSGGGGTGAANGLIGEYEVYGSNEQSTIDADWGEPLSAGSFDGSTSTQVAPFEAASVRYLKLVALTEAGGNPWTTVAELAAAGPVPAPVEHSPSLEAPVRAVPLHGEIAVTAEGFAPGEAVDLSLTRRGGGGTVSAGALQADASGALSGVVPVPEGSERGAHTLTAAGAVSAASAEDRVVLTAR